MKVAGGKDGLAWSFVPAGETKRVYLLAFYSGREVFVLKAGPVKEPAPGAAADAPTELLLKVAKSFVRSDDPIGSEE